MTINGSTNSNGWTYKLEVTETSTSLQNRTSTVQVKMYLGRSNSTSWIAGDWNGTITVAGTPRSVSGNLPYQTWINGGDWKELASQTFTVSNTGNPTTISISSTWSSSGTAPSYASASGNMNLTILHQPPMFTTVEFTEQNPVLTNIGVTGNYFVPYLSIKKINIGAETYDGATITLYEAVNRNNVYSSTTGEVTMNLQQNDLYITQISGRNVVELLIRLTDSLGGKFTGAYPDTNIIPYTKPSIERTSTSIKRKSGGGVNLTDNKATLTLKATFYKGNDAVGNNNSITQIGYKIWETNTTEPTNYTTLTPTISGGNITVNNLEISNISYTKTYNYKIIVKDEYDYEDTIDNGTVPTGQSVWTEYKDRVDFLNITKNGKELYSNIYSTTETIVGKWIDDKPIYRKVISGITGSSAGEKTIAHGISNLDKFIKIDGFTDENDQRILPSFYRDFQEQYALSVYYANATDILITYGSARTSKDFYLILEYTKTTD